MVLRVIVVVVLSKSHWIVDLGEEGRLETWGEPDDRDSSDGANGIPGGLPESSAPQEHWRLRLL
jgi:hypothetical protein